MPFLYFSTNFKLNGAPEDYWYISLVVTLPSALIHRPDILIETKSPLLVVTSTGFDAFPAIAV